MNEITDQQLAERAKAVIRPHRISGDFLVGDVGAALVSENGKIYTGVCIDTGSGMGFCAEHSAIAAMVTAGEYRFSKIVAVWQDGTVVPPCGRCREFMRQIDKRNLDAEVMISKTKTVLLRELLPYHEWLD
jgi:cytidine deaminase